MATQSIAVVDPISTGACVANDCASRGYAVIAVWTKDIGETMRSHVPQTCKDLKYKAEVNELATIAETVAAVREAAGETPLAACIVGGESGVTLADRLSEELGLKTNGTQIPQRRDKKVQQELVKAAGLRSVRQAGGTSWSDVKEFVETEPMPVVVKPVESAGSDGVKLCKTKEEAEEHFHLLMTAQQKVGSQGAAVLVQEFLRGKEYVIDHVSHNGVHKTTMVWVYDKRPVNGSAFVYYGMVPVPSDSPEAEVLIPYIRGVLDALQIKFGPTHGEAMMTDNGPCLVEMNCRAHGGDGAWIPLAKALTGGYTMVSAGVDAFVNEASFEKVPDVPPSPFKASGQIVMMVSMAEGKVVGLPGYEQIQKMKSFVSLETGIDIGSSISYTVDLFSMVGQAVLMHPDTEVVKKDVEAIRQMEVDCTMFALEEHAETLGRPRTGSENLRPHYSEIAAGGAPANQGSWCALM